MFEIYFKNKIFFSHLGQSSNRNFDTDIISNYWCNSINNYLIVETIKPFALENLEDSSISEIEENIFRERKSKSM